MLDAMATHTVMKTETIDTLATAGSRTTGGGAVVGFLGWLASSQAIGLFGVGTATLTAQADATINVSSNATVRVSLRDFTLDVSVTTMLREISARTEPLSVVAMTAQRQVNATTKKQEVAVTA